MNTVNPKELPSVPLSERKALPDKPGIYFAISPSDEVLYVGRTRSLFLRWQAHHRRKQLEGIEGVRIAWLLVSDRSLLPEIEHALIEYFSPRFNRAPVPRIGGQKITVSMRLPAALMRAVERIAINDERTVSNTIEWLIKTHPRVQEILEPETAATSLTA